MSTKRSNKGAVSTVSSCDFNLTDVFKKCDKIGAIKFDLSFQGGMSTQKVLKVLLYREAQFLEKRIQNFMQDKPKASKKLGKTLENIIYLFSISRGIFDNTVISSLLSHFLAFFQYDKKELCAFLISEPHQTLWLDFEFFLFDESGFYLLKKSNVPILFFVQDRLKKEDFRVAKKLKKAISSV